MQEHFTHTLFDLEILFSKCQAKAPEDYKRFIDLLSDHDFLPAKPIDTTDGIQKGDLELPREFADPKTDVI